MGCTSFGLFTVEYGWILGRQDIRNTTLFNEVKERAIKDFGFKTAGAIESPQEDCSYDVCEMFVRE